MMTREKLEKSTLIDSLDPAFIEEVIREQDLPNLIESIEIKGRRTALIVVDVQNDFVTGSMALKRFLLGEDGRDVIPCINRLTELVYFDIIAFSRDSHPENHCSFIVDDKKKNGQKGKGNGESHSSGLGNPLNKFPPHCVAGTWGSKYASGLNSRPKCGAIIEVIKGTEQGKDEFSAFGSSFAYYISDEQKTLKPLSTFLTNECIDILFICGLATDYCVLETCKDARKIFPLKQTYLLFDACRGTTPFRPNIFKELGVKLTTTDRLIQTLITEANLVSGDDGPSTER